MDKQRFIELMNIPEKMSGGDFIKLEKTLIKHPYFQNGHLVIARASRNLKAKSAKRKLNTAATYSTNRNLFKAYIQGQHPIDPSSQVQRPPAKVQPVLVAPPALPQTEEDSDLIKDVYENLRKWKESRKHYLEYDKAHPEEIVIEPVEDKSVQQDQADSESFVASPEDQKNQVAELKNIVAEEILAEEKQLSEAISEIVVTPIAEKQSDKIQESIKDEVASSLEMPHKETVLSLDNLSAIIDDVVNEPKSIEKEERQQAEIQTNKQTREPAESLATDEPNFIVDQISPEGEEEIDISAAEILLPESKKTNNTSSVANVSTDELTAIVNLVLSDTIEQEQKTEDKATINDIAEEGIEQIIANAGDTKVSVDATEEKENKPATPATSEVAKEVIDDDIEDVDLCIKTNPSMEENAEIFSRIDEEKNSSAPTPLNTSFERKKFMLSTLKHDMPFTKPRKKHTLAKSKESARIAEKVATKKKADDQSNKKKRKQDILIDKFIECNPSIKMEKETQANTTDFAASSEAFPHHIISKNLAHILVAQGKISLAITIYKKLLKKYPQNQKLYQLKIKDLEKKLDS